MDYRNLPIGFAYGGLDLVSPPENVPPGKWTRLVNIRYRREGTLEARPGTVDFSALFTQPSYGGRSDNYPNLWNVGPIEKSYYVGKIFANSVEIDGYLFINGDAEDTVNLGNSSNYRVFINGVPVNYNGCSYFLVKNAVSPRSISVIRTVAKTGVPIILLDGRYYLINKECDITVPPLTTTNYQYGPTNTASSLPVFRAYKVGITAPDTKPTAGTATSGGSLTLSSDYFYAYSYYASKTGFESELSPSSDAKQASGSNKTIPLTNIENSSDPQVDKIRIWRKGGTLTNSWRLITTLDNTGCAEEPPADLSYNDGASDQDIAIAEKFDTDTIAPFSSINSVGTAVTEQEFNYAWGPFLGKYHFWVGDPVLKGYVYWNKVGDISRYNSLAGVTSVSDPGEILQNGFIFSSVPFVFSRMNLYALDYGGVDALPEFTPRLVPIGMGLAGKWAFAVGSNAVFFLAKDGIYATNCQPGLPQNLTETSIKTIFQGKTVNDVEAIDWSEVDNARMAVTPKELHFFYMGIGGNKMHLVYDIERGAWSQWTNNTFINAYYDEGNASNRVIFGDNNFQQLFSLDDSIPEISGESFPVYARSGTFNNSIPLTYKQYGVFQLDADLDGQQVTFTPYYNSEVDAGTAVPILPNVGDGRRDYPFSLSDYYARSLSLQFSWTESPGNHPILYQGNLLFRDEEERITHWEQPPDALGNGGWFHIKDGWIAIRSESLVTLTVVIDNDITDTYLLPSTGGQKEKLYVEFKPRKGKLFQFKLDSVANAEEVNLRPFRFYGESTIIYGKPWITGATYQPISVFGAPGYAQYRRTEGGT